MTTLHKVNKLSMKTRNKAFTSIPTHKFLNSPDINPLPLLSLAPNLIQKSYTIQHSKHSDLLKTWQFLYHFLELTVGKIGKLNYQLWIRWFILIVTQDQKFAAIDIHKIYDSTCDAAYWHKVCTMSLCAWRQTHDEHKSFCTVYVVIKKICTLYKGTCL
jgi:hypothetical protein